MDTAASPLFRGCATALVTPFRDGVIDMDAYTALVRGQIEAGVDALVVAGTTGESPTLTDREKAQLITATVQEAAGAGRPLPVLAGTGSNNTTRAVELSRMAEACGASGLLVVTPYYNKASEAGLIAHYTTIADATSLPVILYHVPGRTGCRLTPAACRALSVHPRMAGLKDATGDLAFTARVAAACGEALPIYAGNDDLTIPTLALGGLGVISVVSNLLPERMVRLCRLWAAGQVAEATREQLAILPLCDALFSEVNPIPIKYAMACMGACTEEVRLPLAVADERVRSAVETALRGLR